MAVYKPTLCYPFLNSMDLRVAQYGDFQTSIKTYYQYLSCKIDNSNKPITGYKVRILTSDNQQVFPVDANGKAVEGYISPIEELQLSELGFVPNTASINSGLNGTTLRMPFFQNQVNPLIKSYNAVYYKSRFLADYVIKNGLEEQSDLAKWKINPLTGNLEYDWTGASSEAKKANEIKLDGEVILKGEIILVIGDAAIQDSQDTVDCTGLWIVDGILDETTVTMTTFLRRATNDFFDESGKVEVTLLKGKTRHNHTYIFDDSEFSRESVTGGTWTDVSNNTIALLDSNKTSYKWEVTLYQGNGRIVTDTNGMYIVYENVDPEWLDMTLTSGKILGSTPERIQISDINEEYIPEGLNNAPIVLQNRYIELGTDSTTGIFSGGVRVNVKTYDSVYGHVYPVLDSLNTTNIENTNRCQFFKYSSDPAEILNTDIISFVYTSSISLQLIGLSVDVDFNAIWSDVYDLSQESEFRSVVPITQRHLIVSTAGVPGNLDSLIKEGDTILLQNQSDPKTNGIYTVSKLTAKQVGETTTLVTYWCLSRAAGYNTWGNYIGKIIYCKNGSGQRGVNMQSLASAGGSLWDPNSNTSGSSALYFVQERPILLFPNKLKPNRTFNLFDTINSRPALDTATIGTSIDGVSLVTGDVILYKDGNWGTISEVTSTEYKLSAIEGKYGAVEANDYVYILNGQTLGQLVFKYTTASATYNTGSANWDLHTAKVLKNTTTCTYISPWKELQNNMKIELLNNKTVLFDGSVAPTRWIKIETHNNTVFKITHAALSSPLVSYNKTDATIPWSYDIKFFFRTSDENPFYSYETPYLSLYKNDEFYSDLKIVGGTFYYYVRPNQTSPAIDEFMVNDTQGGALNLLITNYESQAVVTGRSVKLTAEYIGLGQSSWESYRWILYNSDGKIVQDTQKRYDKDLSVTFFGLSNDTSENIVYKAVLLVENNFGDIISYVIDLLIYPGSISSFLRNGGKFTATFDCSTHSTIINFLESSATAEADENVYLYSIYRREYEILDNPNTKIYCYYKDGQCYNTEDYNPDDIVIKGLKYVYIDNNTKKTYKYDPESDSFIITEAFRVYKGEWEPVIIVDNKKSFRDFNISNHRTYQYIVYPSNSQVLEYGLDTTQQTFANYNGLIWISNDAFAYIQPTDQEGHLEHGSLSTSVVAGEPISTKWESWSITELIPEELDIDAPVVRKKYKVDNDNIWLFKYSLDTGSITQNITKEEFQTLGRFSKYGFGDKNFASGSVSAYLGRELILSSKMKYVERLGESRIKALTTNERVLMSQQWQDFCYSKNPKLLKDIKGNAWIVQITSNNITPSNFITGTPEIINFEWQQVDTVNNIIIYGDYEEKDVAIKESIGATEWKKIY